VVWSGLDGQGLVAGHGIGEKVLLVGEIYGRQGLEIWPSMEDKA
jgi:hypothetical protein